MKSMLVSFAIALLGIGAVACGNSGKNIGSTSKISSTATVTDTTPSQGYTKVDSDKDNDFSAAGDEKNNNSTLNYGHAASVSDTRAITAVITRYYAVAVAGDGRKACSILYSSLAEAIQEDYGRGSEGPSYLRTGKTCSEVMVLLFKHFHSQFTAEFPKLEVTRVRLSNKHRGLAVLSFRALPEREIFVAREGYIWKMNALVDSELP